MSIAQLGYSAMRILAHADRTAWEILAVLLLLVVTLFVMQVVRHRRRFIDPLKRIGGKVTEIVESGEHLGEQVEVPEVRDLADVATAINRMSASLRANRDELEAPRDGADRGARAGGGRPPPGRAGRTGIRAALPHTVRLADGGVRAPRDHLRRRRHADRLPLHRGQPRLRAVHRSQGREDRRPDRSRGPSGHGAVLDRHLRAGRPNGQADPVRELLPRISRNTSGCWRIRRGRGSSRSCSWTSPNRSRPRRTV